jgi:nucleoside-diphosphate-sugar epimerase
VTGGAGFIGSHLVDDLLAADSVVRVLDNLSTGLLRNLHANRASRPPVTTNRHRLELVVGDVRDTKLVRKAMRGVDCVFHLAGLPPRALTADHLDEMHSVHVQGTLNVLRAATVEGVRRVVVASCGSVYGEPERAVLSEDDPPRPASLFAASKLAGEIYCRAHAREHAIETVILRYFTVYGPRQPASNSPFSALLECLARRVLPVLGPDADQPRDFLHVDDAARATLTAGHAPAAAGLVLNIASGEAVSPREILRMLGRCRPADGDAPPPGTGTTLDRRASVRVSTALARRVLKIEPTVELLTGLSRLVETAEAEAPHAPGLLAEVGTGEERADV